MKRSVSLILAAMLIVAAAAAFSAVSFADGGAVFTMNDVENVTPGSSFDITLHISGDYEVHGMNLSVQYDPNALMLESCSQGEYLTTQSSHGCLVLLDAQKYANAGMIKLGIVCPIDGATGEGDMMTMRFHVKEGVTVNQQVIMVVQEFVYMPLGQSPTPVEFTTDNAIITLANGATPPGGYNDGDHGIGGNGDSNTPFPTRDPSDPDSNITPAVDVTPPVDIPDVTPGASAGLQTTAPVNSGDPGEQKYTDSPEQTADPEKPTEPVRDNDNTATELPTPAPEPTKTNALPFIIIGAVVALAVVAAVLLIRGRKHE